MKVYRHRMTRDLEGPRHVCWSWDSDALEFRRYGTFGGHEDELRLIAVEILADFLEANQAWLLGAAFEAYLREQGETWNLSVSKVRLWIRKHRRAGS